MPDEASLRATFDTVASLYDEVRPGYSDAIIDALLVLEASYSGAAGSILHIYAVACDHLQHPDGVGLTAEGLEGLRRNLADALDGEAPVEELRRRARLATDGGGYSRRQRAQIARGLDGVRGHDDSPFRTAKRRWVA